MIKIFYDHQKFTTQKYGGISRYFANLINQIKTEPDYSYLLGVLYSKNHYLKDQFGLLNNAFGKALLQSEYDTKAYKLNQLYCKYLLEKNAFDIFHPTYYDPYFIGKVKKPVVITVHDMTHERLPEYFWAEDRLTHNKRLNIERADQIIAISETTKNDLIKYSDVNPEKIKVIYHGIDLNEPFISSEIPHLPESYLLFVGDRSGYKNFYLFIDAFEQISKKYPEIEVILTGGGPIHIAESEYIHRLGLQNKIRHINVTDNQLNFLYEHALAFVYPSLHEGFGLPILEAYKAQCPIILSDTECFREIARDAAVYFNAHETDSLITAVEAIVSDTALRADLTTRGLERIKIFPIEKSVDQTLDMYKALR